VCEISKKNNNTVVQFVVKWSGEDQGMQTEDRQSELDRLLLTRKGVGVCICVSAIQACYAQVESRGKREEEGEGDCSPAGDDDKRKW